MGLIIGNKIGISGTRQGSLLNLEAEAKAYIEAEGITNIVQKKAINQLVKDLKAINAVSENFVNFSDNSLSNRKAIYPFPGTGALNTRNLLNPADTDGAFRLVFSAAPTISAKGVNFGGTKYADTKLIPSTVFDLNDIEFSVALTEPGSEVGAEDAELGAYQAGGSVLLQTYKLTANKSFSGYIGSTNSTTQYITVPGFRTQLKRNAVTAGSGAKINKDGYFGFNAAILNGALPTNSVYLGKANGLAWVSNKTFGFAGIGKYISDEADVLYYAAIARYNHALGRCPLNNLLFEGHSFFDDGRVMLSHLSNKISIAGKMTIGYKNFAVSGSKISDLVSRASSSDAYIKSITGVPIKNVMIVWVGTNETETDATVNYNALASYLGTQSAKGWHFIVCTMTPRNPEKAWRTAYNDHIRANTAGISNYHVVNTDSITELSDATNLTYFNADGIHLTDAGKQVAASAIQEVLAANF